MRQDDRPYLEIRITLIHIVIMIVAVILLGFLLTYLGYKAGRSSAMDHQAPAVAVQEFSPQTQELTVTATQVHDDIKTETEAQPRTEPAPEPVSTQPPATDKTSAATSAIEEELRLHKNANLSENQSGKTEPPPEAISPKSVSDKEYFAIQVGAFGSFQNAKVYATHFNEMGYKTEIVSSEGAGGTLYRLWVGQFENRNQAMQEKSKLEKKENRKFSLVRNR